MKKIVLLSLFIFSLFSAFNSKAQQLPMYSQYLWNDYVLNPAYTGASEFNPIQLSYRKQWMGFNGSPETITLGGHAAINKSMAIGGMVFKDATGGAFSQTGALLNYAYRIKLDRSSVLAFGLSLQLNQYNFNVNKINPLNTTDAALQTGSQTSIAPDASFGMLYQFKQKFKIGVAVNQLMQYQLKKISEFGLSSNQLIRHYNLMCSYNIKINQEFAIEPSILLKATGQTPVQADMSVKAEYRKLIWLGLTYRPQDAVVLMLGFQYHNMILCYSYDATLSVIRTYSTGSNEILIGYRIMSKKAHNKFLSQENR